MRRIAWLGALVPIGVAWACSSAGNHPSALEGNPGQDSGFIVPVRDTGAADTSSCVGASAPTCNALQLCGLEVSVVTVTTAAPMPTGGAIADGTYVLTDVRFYQTGPQAVTATLRQVFQISASGSGSDGGVEGGADGGAEAGAMEAGSDDASDDGSADAGTVEASVEAAADAGGDGGPGLTTLTAQDIHQEPPGAPVSATWILQEAPPTTLLWSSTCGFDGGVSSTFEYTATTSSLLLFDAVAGAGTIVSTFTKQ